MIARANSSNEFSDHNQSQLYAPRRTALRYRFAQLLSLEQFDQALQEALAARSANEIFQCDLQFVVEIVKAAERVGRANIDHAIYPEALFDSAKPVEPLSASSQYSIPSSVQRC
jgi:hypothetical protein